MLFLGTLCADGGINMYLENKGGTYLVRYQSKTGTYMLFALDGTLLQSTFKNTLYIDVLRHELMVRHNMIMERLASGQV